MKKIALIVMLVVMAVFAGQTESGLVDIAKNKYGTELTFRPNTSVDAGHVYSVVMNGRDGFKSIEIKLMDGTVQYYSFDEEKMPSVTTKAEDRVLSWESLAKPKFLKTWDSCMKYLKDFPG